MRSALLTFFAIVIAVSVQAQPPDHFHDLDEYYDALHVLQNQYPDYIHIDTVGYTETEQIPLLLVKVSDNPEVDEDEPAVFIVGHIHGEEILGNEITLAAIEALVSTPNFEFHRRRTSLETYFMPTMNPEGMTVVFGDPDDPDLIYGPDITYRKNRKDNLNDGIFHYQPGWGNDTSGVDPNRNFDINFYHGDSLLHLVDETEPYDYYRGAYPFSEVENQVVRDLHWQIQPLYGITYHSSRQGGLSEKVFYPWDWGVDGNDGLKLAPDQPLLNDVAVNYANQIEKLGGGYYTPLPSAGRNAKMHDWTYAAGGWINLECEVGTANIQPSESITQLIIDDNLPGIWHLLDRAVGIDMDNQSASLALYVEDESGLPLEAEILFPSHNSGYFSPRITDPVYGVYRRATLSGNYDVTIRKFGYETVERTVNSGSAGEAAYTTTLVRKPHHFVHLRAIDAVTQEAVPATFVVKHDGWYTDTLFVASGDYRTQWPEGSYYVEAWSSGRIPRSLQFEVTEPYLMQVAMTEPEDVVFDGFEAGVPDHWSMAGDFDWTRSGFEAYDGIASLKSDPDLFYESDTWGEATVTYDIPDGAESLTLSGWVRYELEPDYDFCYVERSIDGTTWTPVDTLNGFSTWRTFMFNLRDIVDQTDMVSFRWRVETDSLDVDRGVFLDNIVLASSSAWVNAGEEEVIQPLEWELKPAYPNPFNASTSLQFTLRKNVDVDLAVYDILGREVTRLVNERLEAGAHTRTLDMTGYSSGVYFVRLDAGEFRAVQKIVLMK